jgi:hypothetical protein
MGNQLSSRSTDTDAPSDSFADVTVDQILEQNLLGNAMFLTSVRGGDEPTATPTPTDFSTRAQALFPRIDTDGNGFLSGSEIDAAVEDSSYRGPDAAVVATLHQLASELEELSNDEWGDENDGPTLADLQAYERTGAVAGGLRERVEAMYAYGQSRISAGSPLLYGPTGAPTVAGVNQGMLGDCYFLAAVAAVVSRNPSDITSLIADNLDGTYTVTFPNQDPITVNGPTDAELAQYAVSMGNGFWVTILEKAYGKYKDSDGSIPSEAADDGFGSAATGIAFLTGHDTNLDTLGLTERETTKQRLTEAFAAHRIVVAGVRNAMPWTDGNRDDGLPMGHAYTVMGWDEATETLTIRNPWGHGERNDDADTTDDGIFTMTLDEFLANFTTIAYEESE